MKIEILLFYYKMTTEEKCPEKIQFVNPPAVTEFLDALSQINSEFSLELASELEYAHEDINLERKLIIGNKYDLSYIIDTYETLNHNYWTLYYNGTVKAFVNLFNKCVSLEYVMELLDSYVYALNSKVKHSLLNYKEFLNTYCTDEECLAEMTVIHLGLFNAMRLLYPCIDCSLVKFTKVNVGPLKKEDLLCGIKFNFKFQSDEYEEEDSFIEYAVEFSEMRRCAVIQSVKCMQPSYIVDSNLTCCNLVDRSEQYISQILSDWKSNRK